MSFKSFGKFIKRAKLNTTKATVTAYEATKQAVNDTIEGYKTEGTDVVEAEVVKTKKS